LRGGASRSSQCPERSGRPRPRGHRQLAPARGHDGTACDAVRSERRRDRRGAPASRKRPRACRAGIGAVRVERFEAPRGKGPGGASEAEGDVREGPWGTLTESRGFSSVCRAPSPAVPAEQIVFPTAGQRSRCNPKRPQSVSVGRWPSRTDRRTERRPISVVRSRQIRSDAPRTTAVWLHYANPGNGSL
jgi:hypothetical protein